MGPNSEVVHKAIAHVCLYSLKDSMYFVAISLKLIQYMSWK